MIILGNVCQVLDESKLSITWYHRVPIGLERGTTVYLVLLPKASSHNMAEVILTPISPDSWGDLWKIRCKFHEKPGVVAALLQFLSDRRINILVQESVTTQQNRTHFVSIIADLRHYEAEENHTWKRIANTRLDSLEVLENEIAIATLEHTFMENDRPAVTVTRMQNFHKAYFSFRQRVVAFNPTVLQVGKYGVISFSEQPLLIEAIKSQLWGNLRNEQKKKAKIHQVILNTHTEDRYISLLFPDPTTNLAAFKIVHEERIGALATISNVIRELGLNILNSFNRLQKMGTEAHWNLILDIGSRDVSKVKDQILELTQNVDRYLIKRIEERPTYELEKRFTV